MKEFKALESLLRNHNVILEFIKDDMPQTNDVKELAGIVKIFYTRHILKECRNLTLDIDDRAQVDDDADDDAEIDYEKD